MALLAVILCALTLHIPVTSAYPADIRLQLQRVNSAGQITQADIEEDSGGGWTSAGTRYYGHSDSDRLLTQELDMEREQVIYGYDSMDRMTSRQVGAGGPVTTYDYDDRNRLTLIDYPAGTTDVSFQYDENGNVKQVTRGATDKVYSYDVNDNLATETHTYDGQIFNISYSYDTLDFLNTITYPSGRVVTYAPDALGRPTQVTGVLNTQTTDYVTNITWHPSGHINTLTYANGRTLTQTETPRTWPENKQVDGIGGAAMDLTYSYDGLGNVTSIVDNQTAGQNKTLGYDVLNRLTSASGGWGSGTIQYDALSNITQQTLGSEVNLNYNYSPVQMLGEGNRLTDIVDHITPANNSSFSYDHNGNITSDGKDVFIYDESSNLIEVLCSATEPGLFYTYDGDDQRIKERKNGIDKYFIYSKGGQLLGEYDALGNTLKEYIYLGTELIAEVTSTLPPNPTETVTYLHTDVLGSPVAATDQSGNVLWREDYNPYGDKRLNEAASTNRDVWYTGKQYENRTGLSYFGARYYDPTVGRFTGMDPVRFDGANIHTFNRYAYANNNPYLTSDPIGLRGGWNTYLYASANPLLFIDPRGLVDGIPHPTPEGRTPRGRPTAPISGPYPNPDIERKNKIANKILDQLLKRCTGLGGLASKSGLGLGIGAIIHMDPTSGCVEDQGCLDVRGDPLDSLVP